MVVVVPDPGQFDAVEGRLDGAFVQRVIGLVHPSAIDLRLPRFSFTTQGTLQGPLSDIGAPAAFTSGQADFSGISTDEALDISDFPQQAFLSADEEGTDASAVTVVPAEPPVPPVTRTSLVVDRPFIVMVVDRVTREPLLLGRVADPGS
jgi:serpin B